ncbi:MAG: anti-sigma factor [Candidatus Eremiobacteraeota bacterium]|nr:anti-sigma factor [Candidatus Eremiobacteraeota bacterium]MBV9056633.1 anti-sigma factor [Candidatus Eremiobacteraeota bacterium]MBV9700037.1 anti-sigma factor [Candidatus Eremiobacteraeota bacterium]
MSAHEELLDNVAAYALGALPPSDAAGVERHLRTCAECRREYESLRPAVTAVAYSAEACETAESGAAVASPLLKSRIMRKVRAEAAPRRLAPPAWPAYLAAAACLALATVTGLQNLSLNDRLNRERAQTTQQVKELADLAAPDSKRMPFHHGEVVMHGPRLYIAMHDMPMPPRGKVYQAWTLAKGAKRVAPSMTFMPKASGTTLVALPEAATTLAAVAISVEPEGGSLQPTSKPIALVAL